MASSDGCDGSRSAAPCIGMMFFGVLEPVYHMAFSGAGGAPLGVVDGEIVAADIEAARASGLAATIYHWALHPCAIYAIVGLPLALFAYNKGLPLSVRSIFYPIFGECIWGWTGHVIDILAVFATLFGLATSLGIGAHGRATRRAVIDAGRIAGGTDISTRGGSLPRVCFCASQGSHSPR